MRARRQPCSPRVDSAPPEIRASFCRSNLGSRALMQRKKRSREASANRGTLKTGWYGVGKPFRASIPKTAESRREQHRQFKRDRE